MGLHLTLSDTDVAPLMIKIPDGRFIELRRVNMGASASHCKSRIRIEADQDIKIYNPNAVIKEGFDYNSGKNSKEDLTKKKKDKLTKLALHITNVDLLIRCRDSLYRHAIDNDEYSKARLAKVYVKIDEHLKKKGL